MIAIEWILAFMFVGYIFYKLIVELIKCKRNSIPNFYGVFNEFRTTAYRWFIRLLRMIAKLPSL